MRCVQSLYGNIREVLDYRSITALCIELKIQFYTDVLLHMNIILSIGISRQN